MIIALVSPCIASTLDEGLDRIKRLLSEASAQGAEIVCFPEAYLPGLRGAKIVFHPPHTGSDREDVPLAQWGAAEARRCFVPW